MKQTFAALLLLLITLNLCVGQNSYPATGTALLNSGGDQTLILKDGRAGTNWNYIEWQFSDGSRDWVLGRRPGGYFTLWRTGVNEVVTVDSNGNMGIGTTTPQAKLDVNGSIAVNGVGVITNGGNDVYANIRVLRNTSTQYTDGMYIGYMGSGGPLRFFSNSGTTEFMTLSTAGNLGLGTTSPSSWFPGKVFEMSDVRPVLKMSSTSPTGLSTIVFTNGSVNATSHVGEFHVNHDFDPTTNEKSLIRFSGYPVGDILALEATGHVGIGTITPGARLHVVTPSTNTGDNSAIFQAPNIGSNTSHVHWGTTGDWYIRSANSGGKVIIQDSGGNVGIGTSNPNQKLTVNGTIYGKEVKVDLNVPAPDYVFEKDYNLPSLEEIKNYVVEHKHLPEVPSAKEMQANGINLSEMNMLLLKKMEEMTLYMIEQKREIQELRNEISEIKKQN